MAKSIKLKDNTFWDNTAIRYNIARKIFNIPANGTIKLSFSYSNFILLFSSKGGLGGANECWVIATYGNGGTARTNIQKLLAGTNARALSYQINDDRTIDITNPNNIIIASSLVFLVGDPKDVLIS